jgi:DNA-binding response OmpR family regulator
MNVILVTNENQIKYSLSHKFFPIGINIFHFRKCSNAITSLNDINPDVIIVDTDEERRTWKPLITVIRSNKADKKIVFLLIMSSCDLETANQALYLGVNGIILKPFHETKSILKIIQLIRRHIELEKKRYYIRVKPDIEDSMIFIYNDMIKRRIIKGQVTDISANGISINLNMPFEKGDFQNGINIQNCMLKIKGFEIHFDFFVMWYKPPVLGGMFVNINPAEFAPVYNYLLDKLSDIYQLNKSTAHQDNSKDENDLKNEIEELKEINENDENY